MKTLIVEFIVGLYVIPTIGAAIAYWHGRPKIQADDLTN